MEVKKKKAELEKMQAEKAAKSDALKPDENNEKSEKKKDEQEKLLDAFEQEIFDWSKEQVFEFQQPIEQQ